MIGDLRTVPNDASLEADICIIGGGAAGIVMARQFISSRCRVILLESGGLRREARTQALYSGHSVGDRYFRALHECRSRYFGGSTNCWVGICTPLNEIDFQQRPWVPWSGWPIGLGELTPYLREAHQVCGNGPFIYNELAWQMMGLPPAQFNPERFDRFVWHFNKDSNAEIEFGKRFRNELRRASNVQVFLNANATELLTDPAGKVVDRARVRTLDGRAFDVRAKAFVLACGGIENARILLASTGHYPTGLGNGRDLVGRYFQEHFEVPCGTLLVPDGQNDAVQYSRLAKAGGTFCLAGLALAAKAQELHQTLNGSISVDPFCDQDGPVMAFQNLLSDVSARRFNRQTMTHLWRVARGARELAPITWQRLVYGDRPRRNAHRFVIYARTEQAPNPDSRITLANDVDELGMRRAVLDWRTTPLDRKAIRLLAAFAVEEFTRLGLGQVLTADWLTGTEWPANLVGGNHHMGTTRMADDASAGVVDRNCRIHGLDGLYVAGSSVFPTSGYANPTLTIIALALRLANHLRDHLAPNMPQSGRKELASIHKN